MWIFFDLDDTLYDFATSSLIGLRYIYRNYGIGRHFASEQEWIDCYHRHNRSLWTLYNAGKTTQAALRRDRFFLPLTEGGFPAEEAEALTRELDTVYLDQLAATGLLLPGAIETITELKRRGHRIGVLSNGFCGVQEGKLKSSGLESLIDCVVLSDEIGINKPDRRIFDYALRKSGATASTALMVGDNPETDIAGALAAGWQAVLLSPTASTSSPCAAITTLDQLTHLPLIP